MLKIIIKSKKMKLKHILQNVEKEIFVSIQIDNSGSPFTPKVLPLIFIPL